MSAVPMMTRELLAHPNFGDYDTSSLASLGGGGAAMHPDLPSKVIESTQRAKPAQGYGMTEVCGISTYTAGDLFLARPESCGPLVPTLEGKVVNEAGEIDDGGRDAAAVGAGGARSITKSRRRKVQERRRVQDMRRVLKRRRVLEKRRVQERRRV